MSDFTGPGVYSIIPRHADTQCINLWGGAATNGTGIKLYRKTPQADNSLWEIVEARNNSNEYHIICYSTGTMICAAADGSGSVVTANTRAPKEPSTRWKLQAAKNGSGAYLFESVVKPGDYLAVAGAGTAEGTDLMTWIKQDANHFQFFLRAPTA
ncbi:hypothetical protein MMC30_008479 [Trapelia coarctata]|nr:hypothetical protein [Trapelia coarctata]